MKKIVFLLIVLFSMAACQKEKIEIGQNVSETFYLENANAAMHVLVEGNTESLTFLVFVHGGPGTGSQFYNTDFISNHIENKYACVYWDQRNSGESQGGANSNDLSLEQMTEDLKKLLQLIKYRYGDNSSIFILGHSFGGLLTSSFMTTDNCQELVNGWIFMDGSHNYPLNNEYTKEMLIKYGLREIEKGLNEAKWEEIVAYCNSLGDEINHNQADQLNSYSYDAEELIDSVDQFNVLTAIKKYAIKNKWSIASIFFNHMYTANATFNDELAKTEFSSQLKKVTKPTLLLFGKYDFICPVELGWDIYNNINSEDKQLEQSDISGHNPIFQDEEWFCENVNYFIEQYR